MNILHRAHWHALRVRTAAGWAQCASGSLRWVQVKCSVLLWDLDAEETIVELFSTVFGAYK